jgi:hypothetical protein
MNDDQQRDQRIDLETIRSAKLAMMTGVFRLRADVLRQLSIADRETMIEDGTIGLFKRRGLEITPQLISAIRNTQV